MRKRSLRRRINPDSRIQNQSMKTTVSKSQFVDSFRACGRETQFSRAALFALFEYLEEYENSTGEEIELDPIGICCEWAEFSSAREAASEYGFEAEDDDEAEKWLGRKTTVVQFDGGLVVQQF